MSKKSEVSCPVFQKKVTTHMATLPTGIKVCIQNTFITVKPSRYRINNLNTMIHSVVHYYYPDKTEANNVPSQVLIQSNNCLELNLIDRHGDILTNMTV